MVEQPDPIAPDAADHFVDALDLLCPEPLMIVRNKVRQIAVGETVGIIATDPSTRRDFANFCRFLGHELLLDDQADGQFRFIIRKVAAR